MPASSSSGWRSRTSTASTGIAPAIAIRQKNSIRNPRSTVGTTTEIHDYLRLLWARVGRTICRQCGKEVERESPDVVADASCWRCPPGTRLLSASTTRRRPRCRPPDAEPDGEPTTKRRRSTTTAVETATTRAVRRAIRSATTLDTLRRRGFGRLLVGGQRVTLDEAAAAPERCAAATVLP